MDDSDIDLLRAKHIIEGKSSTKSLRNTTSSSKNGNIIYLKSILKSAEKSTTNGNKKTATSVGKSVVNKAKTVMSDLIKNLVYGMNTFSLTELGNKSKPTDKTHRESSVNSLGGGERNNKKAPTYTNEKKAKKYINGGFLGAYAYKDVKKLPKVVAYKDGKYSYVYVLGRLKETNPFTGGDDLSQLPKKYALYHYNLVYTNKPNHTWILKGALFIAGFFLSPPEKKEKEALGLLKTDKMIAAGIKGALYRRRMDEWQMFTKGNYKRNSPKVPKGYK